MRKYFYWLEFAAVVPFYWLLRAAPFAAVRALAAIVGWGAWCVPPLRKLVAANVQVAFPEMPEKERARIVRRSFGHMTLNLLEFLWVSGSTKRIEARFVPPPELKAEVQAAVKAGTQYIFVTPHLGSWEATAVMASHYGGLRLAAVAKPLKNPYLNRLLNGHSREAESGVRIIFARGAMRALMQALNEGWSLGLLIDQNTKVREGGAFVRFFGLPVASSRTPAALTAYGLKHHRKVVPAYAVATRRADGRVGIAMRHLPRPVEEYPDETSIVQAFIEMGEEDIRKTPEQYLWLYRRFRYIPNDCPPEIRKRFPYYACEVKPHFLALGGKRKALMAREAAKGEGGDGAA